MFQTSFRGSTHYEGQRINPISLCYINESPTPSYRILVLQVQALIEKAGKGICNCGEKHKLPGPRWALQLGLKEIN